MASMANPLAKDLDLSLNDVLSKVREGYSPQIAEALRAELAVVAAASYADIPCCLAFILEGPSGTGKSALVEMLHPTKENEQYLRREDRFTAASFVSNASNVKKDKLKEIDLLPKIAGKVMLTKELASMFCNDDKALREIFGIVTAVLDGKGYTTATGTHGERGYKENCRFNWIGATTPVPTRVHNIMALFGCRFLFYECNFPEPSYDEILEKMKSSSSYSMEKECNAVVNSFVNQHFERHGVSTVHAADVHIPDAIFKGLFDYARLMTLGRRAVNVEKRAFGDDLLEFNYYASPAEGVYRPLEMFRSIAIGSALIARRHSLTADDVAIVRHIAFSSIPNKRRVLLRRLIYNSGTLTSTDVVEQLGCSKPTALQWMRELAATELCDHTERKSGSNSANEISLRDEFRYLIQQPLDATER